MSPCCLTSRDAGKRVSLVNWGSHRLFLALIQRFQFISTIAKRDHVEYLMRSLFAAHIMASGDTCPQGNSNPCRHRTGHRSVVSVSDIPSSSKTVLQPIGMEVLISEVRNRPPSRQLSWDRIPHRAEPGASRIR